MTKNLFFLLAVGLFNVAVAGDGNHEARYTKAKPVIDGLGNEACWESATWYKMDHRWLGEEFDSLDFQGRFKLAWNENQLFLLVEVIDDSLIDIYPSWDDNWWNDDCVEIFIDENNSDGNHQFNHNAFAYHVLLDYNVVDLGPDQKPHLYNNHVETKRTNDGNSYTWEFAINVFKDTYVDGKENNEKVKLVEKKELGFMLAYCDNDRSKTRENFVGSLPIEGEEKDRGWIDAGVFGTLRLIK